MSPNALGTSEVLPHVVDQPGSDELPHHRTVVAQLVRDLPHPAVTSSQLPQSISEFCVNGSLLEVVDVQAGFAQKVPVPELPGLPALPSQKTEEFCSPLPGAKSL